MIRKHRDVPPPQQVEAPPLPPPHRTTSSNLQSATRALAGPPVSSLVHATSNSNESQNGATTDENADEVAPERPVRVTSRSLPPTEITGINNLADVTITARSPTVAAKNVNPDVTSVENAQDTSISASVTDLDQDSASVTSRHKVSAKIQQLLNTLKRPKKKPLTEFYQDDDEDLEIAAKSVDPNCPKPEGDEMIPSTGESLSVASGLPMSLEAALQRYGSATMKAPAASLLDVNGKLTQPLTYGKLLSRARKIAYHLLNKVGQKEDRIFIRPGDRVAMVYPNHEPMSFMCAFYGCLMAGVVPVPIEVPVSRRDPGSQSIGFLLGSCSVSYALTSGTSCRSLS